VLSSQILVLHILERKILNLHILERTCLGVRKYSVTAGATLEASPHKIREAKKEQNRGVIERRVNSLQCGRPVKLSES
jgi:hypothetical protein